MIFNLLSALSDAGGPVFVVGAIAILAVAGVVLLLVAAAVIILIVVVRNNRKKAAEKGPAK